MLDFVHAIYFILSLCRFFIKKKKKKKNEKKRKKKKKKRKKTKTKIAKFFHLFFLFLTS